MKGWIALIALYTLLVVGGGSFLIGHRGLVNWLATRRLPANHCVAKGDLRPPPETQPFGLGLPDKSDLEGRFLITEVNPNQPIEASNLLRAPKIEPADGESVYWLPLAEQAFPSANLDATVSIDFCPPGKRCFTGRVSAIPCDEKAPRSCFAAIILKSQDRDTLLATGDKPKPLMFVPATRSEGVK